MLTADPKARKGALVGALAVTLGDELYAITSGGGVIRTPVNGVRHNKDRATMGVKLMNLPEDVSHRGDRPYDGQRRARRPSLGRMPTGSATGRARTRAAPAPVA